jgi:hypothetical protein
MASRPDHAEPAQGDWLTGCTGFIVEGDAERIGRVAEVQRDADSGRPIALVVRVGIGGRLRLLVPVHDVSGVVLSSDRIIVDGSYRRSKVTGAIANDRGFGRAARRPLSPAET